MRSVSLPRAVSPACRAPVVLLGLWVLALDVAGAQLPRVSAGLGGGIGGLRREESIAGVPKLTESAGCTAAAWWCDFAWDTGAHWILSLHFHSLTVPIEDGGRVGSFDLLPVLAQVGLRRPLMPDRLWGYALLGAGVTTARFTPNANTARWEDVGGGQLRFTRERPFTIAVSGGLDYVIGQNLLLEVGFGVVAIDSQIAYRRVRGPNEGFEENRGAEVSASHLLGTIGIRWWCDWWL